MRGGLPLLMVLMATSAHANPFAAAASGTLSNGLRVILVPDPSLPVVAATVLVGAGAEREDSTTSGATHLLEHLLFNGTRSMTQEQLYETADLHGIYLNAATRERGTILIGLSPPDELHTLLRLQAEMLFFSIIPPAKFEKEKLIVLEEIAKDRAQPDDVLWLHRARTLYWPSPCRFPILGSPSTIEAMNREAIRAYYRRYYVPNNMTLVLIGAIAWPEAWDTIRATFGEPPAGPLAAPAPCPFAPPSAADTAWVPLQAPSVSFVFAGPGADDPAFPSFFLAARLLPELLIRAHDQAASSWDASLHTGPTESRLLLSATVACADSCGALAARLGDLLAQALAVDDAALRRAAWAWQQEAIRWFERPHMLGVMAYDPLSALGWNGLGTLWETVGSLSAARWCADVGPSVRVPHATLFELVREGPPSYEGLDPVPRRGSGAPPSSLPARRDFAERTPLIDPSSPQVATWSRDVADTLPSGLVIWVRSEPGSALAGMHVLFRQRGALEPAGREGVAEMFHRLVGTGPAGMSETACAQRLDELGALLQVTDDPFLPFDDYYYSSRWGYLRVTSPAESLEAAAALVVEALSHLRADSAVFSRERSAVMAALAREGRSAGKTAARRFWEHVRPEDPRARSPLGTSEGLMRLTTQDILEFSGVYAVGGNMVVTVSTPLDGETTLGTLRRIFQAVPPGHPPIRADSAPSVEGVRLEDSLGVGQGHLLMARAVRASADERPAFEVLAALLDRRMGLELREKHGLAYSLGAQAAFEDSIALLLASVGTRVERLPEAQERLRELLADLSAAPGDSVERRAAAMSLEQRVRLRNLTRVGRAYSMGMDLMRGIPPASWEAFQATRSVTADDLASLASRLSSDFAVVVIR